MERANIISYPAFRQWFGFRITFSASRIVKCLEKDAEQIQLESSWILSSCQQTIALIFIMVIFLDWGSSWSSRGTGTEYYIGLTVQIGRVAYLIVPTSIPEPFGICTLCVEDIFGWGVWELSAMIFCLKFLYNMCHHLLSTLPAVLANKYKFHDVYNIVLWCYPLPCFGLCWLKSKAYSKTNSRLIHFLWWHKHFILLVAKCNNSFWSYNTSVWVSGRLKVWCSYLTIEWATTTTTTTTNSAAYDLSVAKFLVSSSKTTVFKNNWLDKEAIENLMSSTHPGGVVLSSGWWNPPSSAYIKWWDDQISPLTNCSSQ